tara:strand:+ start:1261 stop:3282 length:2022 start_codon:yes stop_codon:yes gene_type:complete
MRNRDLTPEELAALGGENAAPPEMSAQSVASPVGSFARNLQDKLFFNRGNEFSAGVQALPALMPGGQSFSDAYAANMAGLNQEQANLYANNPTAAQASEIAGLSIPAFGVGGLLSKAPMAMNIAADIAAKRFMPRLLSNAVAGGSIAAAESVPFSVGRSESLQDIPGNVAQDATTAALFGGAGGAVLPEVFRLGSRVASSLPNPKNIVPAITGDNLFPQQASNKVIDRFASLLDDSDLTESELVGLLQAGGPKSIPADASRTMLGELDALVNQPGKAKDMAIPLLERRSIEQADDLLSDFGKPGRADSITALEDGRKKIAGPLYNDAFEEGVPHTPELEDIYQDIERSFPNAWKEAKNEGLIAGRANREPVDDLLDRAVDGSERPTLQGWQAVKEYLDDLESSLRTAGKNKQANNVKKFNTRLLDELDELNPKYKEARKIWSGTKRAEELIDEFKTFKTMRPSDFELKWNKLSPEDQEIAMIGITETLNDMVGTGSMTGDATQVFYNINMQKKLKELLSPAQFENLTKKIKILRTQQLAMKVDPTRTSATASREATQADQNNVINDVANATVNAVAGNPANSVGYIGRMFGTIKEKLGFTPNLTREQRDELASYLLEQDVNKVKQFLNQVIRRTQPASGGTPGLLLNPTVSTQVAPGLLGTSTGSSANTLGNQ